jgi:hypothetical protein
MYLTARQLETILREQGQLVLPFGARLTPAAMDVVRAKKLDIRFDIAAKPASQTSQIKSPEPVASAQGTGTFFWWCATRNGAAKAAIAMVSRESALRSIDIQEDACKTAAVVKSLVSAVRNGTARGGILVVDSSGLASVLANRSKHLRAIVGTSLASIESGLRDVSANVLIIEPAGHTLMTLKNMIARFVRGSGLPSPELERELAGLADGSAA